MTADPHTLRSRPHLGLAFAAAASFAELAPIVHLLRQDEGLVPVLAAGLAYQGGGAAARWLPGGRASWLAAAVLAGALLLLAAAASLAWFAALALAAWSLQAARRRHAHTRPADSPTTAAKRAARVLGFVLAALAPFWASLTVVLSAVATAAALRLQASPEGRPRLTGHPIEAVMIIHQTHYFAYCYGLLLILSELAGGPDLVGVWFGVGWVTYLAAERLWGRTPLSVAVVAGHIFVAATLVGLAVYGREEWPAVICWTLTGFGGGTVYCLSRLHRASGGASEALDLAEDIGHVGGVAIALGLAAILGMDAWHLAGVAAVFALATIGSFIALRPLLATVPEGRP